MHVFMIEIEAEMAIWHWFSSGGDSCRFFLHQTNSFWAQTENISAFFIFAYNGFFRLVNYGFALFHNELSWLTKIAEKMIYQAHGGTTMNICWKPIDVVHIVIEK